MIETLLKNIDAFNALYENDIKQLNQQIDKFIKFFNIFKSNCKILIPGILPNSLVKKIKFDNSGLTVIITDNNFVKYEFSQANINVIEDDFEMIKFIIEQFDKFNNQADSLIKKQAEKVNHELTILSQMVLANKE